MKLIIEVGKFLFYISCIVMGIAMTVFVTSVCIVLTKEILR